MQISDYLVTINNTIKVSVIILISLAGLIWLNQQSLDRYWALHFHRESPWSSLSLPVWKQGAKMMQAAEAAKEAFVSELSGPVETFDKVLSRPVKKSVSAANITSEYPKDVQQLSRWMTIHRQTDVGQTGGQHSPLMSGLLYDQQGAAILPSNKKVLFIGDSMMEGVAPRVMRKLKNAHKVGGINLSKRSTGLAYPASFNWPETTARALENNPDIGLLAVFLGPNDPWDMPVSRGQPYLKFGTEAWQEEYRKRIRQILALTEKHNIPVIWVTPPSMRKDKLNRGMAVLDVLYASEVTSQGGIVLRVNDLFGYRNGIYSSTALINEKVINVRASDGIHYTPAGAEFIAEAITGKIHVMSQESEDIHDE